MDTKATLRNLFNKPYQRIEFQKSLVSIFGNSHFKFRPQPLSAELTNTERQIAQSLLRIGNLELDDVNESLPVYEVVLNPAVIIERNRTGVNDLVKKHMISEINRGALAVFTYPENDFRKEWRFSFISKDSGSEYFAEIEKKETPSKRYTYIFGTDDTHKTAIERFEILKSEQITLDKLFEAFSVEKLSKHFFSEYTRHYQDIVQHFTGKRMVKKAGQWQEEKVAEPDASLTWLFKSNEKHARDFAKKLMGRIVFLYFIQKKGWLAASDQNYEDGDCSFIQTLYRECHENYKSFYADGLANLFFNALNTKRENDDFTMPSGQNVKIPFLNGGLFERDKLDIILKKHGDALQIPFVFFSNPDEKEDPNERGFLDFLDSFNFTIDEDNEDEKTVAVDPEMLGHIFENLLEDNKNKGAFYTPKEIVSYMTQESLSEYLLSSLSRDYQVYRKLGSSQAELFGNEENTGQLEMLEKLGEKALNRKEVEFIVRKKDVSGLTEKQLKRIDKLLDEVKICDPAIGSGAFPMGLLQDIFAIKERIAFHLNIPWKPEKVKENIIQNSIYGVDIEKGAVDIARLRFWLSLVVDEQKPKALPNLDYKIMQGDSLLESFGGIPLDKLMQERELDYVDSTGQQTFFGHSDVKESHRLTKEKLEKLEKLVSEYFSCNDKEKKININNEIKQIVNDHIEYNLELEENRISKEIEALRKNIFSIKINDSLTPAVKRKSEKKKQKLEKELKKKLQTQAEYCTNRQQLVEMKTSNTTAFFLWHLYFKKVFDNGGFDIVIGNPPYIQLQKGSGKLGKLYKEAGYETFTSTGDIYMLFYEKGMDILKKGGTLCYITSNKWMRAAYGKSLRNYFSKKNTLKLIDLGAGVFETASVDTNILIVKQENTQTGVVNALAGTQNKPLKDVPEKDFTRLKNLNEDSWVVLSPIEQRIKEKIEAKGTPLKDWDITINYGIKTGLNDAFIIDGATKKRLIKEDPKSAEIIRPILRGRDIKAYSVNFADKYLLFIPWHFPMHHDKSIKGASKIAEQEFEKQYPSVYYHLLKYKDKLEKRNKAETGIRYEWYALQRWGANYWDIYTEHKHDYLQG